MRVGVLLAFFGLVLLFGCIYSPQASQNIVASSGCCIDVVRDSQGNPISCADLIPSPSFETAWNSGDLSLDQQRSPCWEETLSTGDNVVLCNLTIINKNTGDVELELNESVACGYRASQPVCGEGCRALLCSQDLFKRALRENYPFYSGADSSEAQLREIELTGTNEISESIEITSTTAFSLLGTACDLFEFGSQSPRLSSSRIMSFRLGVTGGKEAYETINNYAPLSAEQCQINPTGFVDSLYLYNFKYPEVCRVVVWDGQELSSFQNNPTISDEYSYYYNCTTGDNAGKLFSRYIDCQLSCLSDQQKQSLSNIRGSLTIPSEDACKYSDIDGTLLSKDVLDYQSGIIKVTKDTAPEITEKLFGHDDFINAEGSFDNGAFRLGALPFECVSDSECLSGVCRKESNFHTRSSCIDSETFYRNLELVEGSGSPTQTIALAMFGNLRNCGCFIEGNNKLVCPPNYPTDRKDDIFYAGEIYAQSNPQISCVRLVEEQASDLRADYFNISPNLKTATSQAHILAIYGLDARKTSDTFDLISSIEDINGPEKKTYYVLDRCQLKDEDDGGRIKNITRYGYLKDRNGKSGLAYIAVPMDDHVKNGDTPDSEDIPGDFLPIYGAPYNYSDNDQYSRRGVSGGGINRIFPHSFDDQQQTLNAFRPYDSAKYSGIFLNPLNVYSTDINGKTNLVYPFFSPPDGNVPFYYPVTRLAGGSYVPYYFLENYEFDLPFLYWVYYRTDTNGDGVVDSNDDLYFGRLPKDEAKPFTSVYTTKHGTLGFADAFYNWFYKSDVFSSGVYTSLYKENKGYNFPPSDPNALMAAGYIKDEKNALTNIFPPVVAQGIITDPLLARYSSPYGFVKTTGTSSVFGDNYDEAIEEMNSLLKDNPSDVWEKADYFLFFKDENPNEDDVNYAFMMQNWLSEEDKGAKPEQRLLCTPDNGLQIYPSEEFLDFYSSNILIKDITWMNKFGSGTSKLTPAEVAGSACFGYDSNKEWLYSPFSFAHYNYSKGTLPRRWFDPYGYGFYAFASYQSQGQNVWPKVVPVRGISKKTNFVSLLSANGSVIDIALNPDNDFLPFKGKPRGFFPLFDKCDVADYMPDANYGSSWREPQEYSGEVSGKAVYLSGLDVNPAKGSDRGGLQDKLPDWMKENKRGNYFIEAYYCVNPFILLAQGAVNKFSLPPAIKLYMELYSPLALQNANYRIVGESTLGRVYQSLEEWLDDAAGDYRVLFDEDPSWWSGDVDTSIPPLIENLPFTDEGLVKLQWPCNQLSIKDYCIKVNSDGVCEEFATSMLMFVYNFSAMQKNVPGVGKVSTFGSCLVKEDSNGKPKPLTIDVGACDTCGFLNAYETDFSSISAPEVQKALNVGTLPIVDPKESEFDSLVDQNNADLRKKIRGGPTAVVVELSDEADKLAEACPECLRVTYDTTLQSLISGTNPKLPKLIYSKNSLQLNTQNEEEAKDRIINSLTLRKAQAFGVPAIIKISGQSQIFQDPNKIRNLSITYREELINNGLGGIIFDSPDPKSVVREFCSYEQAFRAFAGRESSYVVGRKDVAKDQQVYREDIPILTYNKRASPVVPESLCLSGDSFVQNSYSAICLAKDPSGGNAVRTFSPQTLYKITTDPLLFDAYSPIIASVGRTSGLYLCKNEGGEPTYTYDLVPSPDILGEAPVLMPNQTILNNLNNGAYCFKEPLTQADILRITGQSVENINCYLVQGCCEDVSSMEEVKDKCSSRGGSWDDTTQACRVGSSYLTPEELLCSPSNCPATPSAQPTISQPGEEAENQPPEIAFVDPTPPDLSVQSTTNLKVNVTAEDKDGPGLAEIRVELLDVTRQLQTREVELPVCVDTIRLPFGDQEICIQYAYQTQQIQVPLQARSSTSPLYREFLGLDYGVYVIKATASDTAAKERSIYRVVYLCPGNDCSSLGVETPGDLPPEVIFVNPTPVGG